MSSKISILLVDDDEVDVMRVKRAMKKLGLTNTLYTAENGIEALSLLRGEESGKPVIPRIILLDLNMPRMGGLEFLKELREDENLRAATVIVLTTSKHESDLQQAFEHNVAGYVVKPVTSDNFIDAIATLNQYWTLSESP